MKFPHFAFIFVFPIALHSAQPSLVSSSASSNNSASQPHPNDAHYAGGIEGLTDDIDNNDLVLLVSGMWKDIEDNKEKDPILLIGPTGVGKTVFSLFMSGHKMKSVAINYKGSDKKSDEYISDSEEEYKKNVIEVDTKDSTINKEIGHENSTSCTLYPRFRQGSKFLYCDCPGFFDTRNIETRISVALSTKAVVDNANSIKSIVFLLTKDHVCSDSSRKRALKECLDILFTMFSNPSDYAKSIFFGFTKTQGCNIKRFLYELSSYRRSIRKKLVENYFGDSISADAKQEYGKKLSIVTSYIELINLINMLKLQAKSNIDEKDIYTDIKTKNVVLLAKQYVFFNLMQKEYKKNFFIFNPLKEETREPLKELFFGAKNIPPQEIKFIGDTEVRNRIRVFFGIYSVEGNKMRKEMEGLRDTITTKEEEVRTLGETIKNKKAIAEVINEIKKEIEANEKKISQKKIYLDTWDHPNMVKMRNVIYNNDEDSDTTCTQKSQQVNIELPYSYVEFESKASVGSFSIKGNDKKNRIKGRYSYPKNETANGKIVVYGRSCDVHKEKISAEKDEINGLKDKNKIEQEKLDRLEKTASTKEQEMMLAKMRNDAKRVCKKAKLQYECVLDDLRKNQAIYEIIYTFRGVVDNRGDAIHCFWQNYLSLRPLLRDESAVEDEEEQKNDTQ